MLSPSDAPQAARLELLNAVDTWAEARNALREIAEGGGEWAGIPMPITGEKLIVEPSYRFAGVIEEHNRTRGMAIDEDMREDEDHPADAPRLVVRNTWQSRQHRNVQVVVIEDTDGKVRKTFMPKHTRVAMDIRTAQCSVVWGIEQEARAVQLLGTLLRHHMFKSYLLTGMFVETSKRSGVSYVFRKLRPTIALKAKMTSFGERMQVLACLCMHPIGYYKNSWAGAMCPTDDVIAHLTMMRADEHMFWKRCNHHHEDSLEAGL